MINKKKFNAVMAEHGDRHKQLADKMGITPQTFSKKFNGKDGADYTRNEIEIVRNTYNLTPQEINEIFFPDNA